MQDIFERIAENDFDAAAAVCDKYGGDPGTVEECADMLEIIATKHGNEGAYDVMSLHPEREMLAGMFNKTNKSNYSGIDGHGRGSDCEKCRRLNQIYQFTNNGGPGASGQTSAMGPLSAEQVAEKERKDKLITISIISLTVIAVAFIVTK